jgi:tRNA G26 N,N-dimethylase Trm1
VRIFDIKNGEKELDVKKKIIMIAKMQKKLKAMKNDKISRKDKVSDNGQQKIMRELRMLGYNV